jgi:single-stranded-DNA-specific exonuclease
MQKKILSDLKIHPFVEKVLVARRYITEKSIQEYLIPDYEKHLHDPMQLPDMEKATRRIKKEVDEAGTIAIYGDYDIDGLTATVLLKDYFTQLGVNVLTYIPDRFEEGYGLSKKGLKHLQDHGADLVISVDCGTSSLDALKWAKRNKLDVIVTDHHEAGQAEGVLPDAIAIINPKLENSIYPFRELAGVGVAFKLVQALQKKLPLNQSIPLGQEKWLLDLVALGTVCDSVNLVGENRVLVHYGLKVLRQTKREGLLSLIAEAKINLSDLDTYHLGYVIGPRLNAAGRIKHAKKALDLLDTKSHKKAMSYAQELTELNAKRQMVQAKILAEAEIQASEYAEYSVLVLEGSDWSHGIVGIVASRILEKYKKPVLILQNMGKISKGSARSFGDFDIVEALKACSRYLSRYGGHKGAAGCTLSTDNIEKLRIALNDHYISLALEDQERHLAPNEEIDVVDFSDHDLEAIDSLKILSPFGRANERPLFRASPLTIVDIKLVGVDKKHVKFSFMDKHKRPIDGIGFNFADKVSDVNLGNQFSAWYELNRNDFNGISKPQLLVKKLEII